jgi:FlaG/FlaF family flagellin (archaellin)
MDKRGISPLVATILLIGVAIIIAIIIFSFIGNVSEDQMETQQEEIELVSTSLNFHFNCIKYVLDGDPISSSVLITNEESTALDFVIQSGSKIYTSEDFSEIPIGAYESNELFLDASDSIKIVPVVNGESVSAKAITRTCSETGVEDLVRFSASCDSEGYFNWFDTTGIIENTGVVGIGGELTINGVNYGFDVNEGGVDDNFVEENVHESMNVVVDKIIFDGSDYDLIETIESTESCSFTNRFGNAIEFDGEEDYIEVSDSESLDTGDRLTVEFWVDSVDSDNSVAYILSKWYYENIGDFDNIFSGFLFSYETYSQGYTFNSFYLGNGVSSLNPNRVIGNYQYLSNLVHIAGVYDGNEMFVYIDGVLDDSDEFSGNIDSESPLTIGRVYTGTHGGTDGNLFFSGKMDELRIWNYARGADDIFNNMDNELNGDESGLVAYYKFNDETNLGRDYSTWSGYENNGTVHGDPTIWVPS